MQITKEIGRKVIERVSSYTDVDINIMNLQGYIVSSTDYSRLNQIHIGAKKVISEEKKIILNANDIKEYPGTKPGVNLPILHQGSIAGVVGVSGNPNKILQITGMIRATTEIVLEQIYMERQMHFEERQWNNWLYQLLHPLGFNEKRLEKEAIYSLKINVNHTWTIVVFIGEKAQNFLEFFRREFKELKVQTLFTLPFADEEVIVAIDSTYKKLNTLITQLINQTDSSIRAGVSHPNYHLKGLRHSYSQAKQALQLSNSDTTISDIKEWKMERLISVIPLEEYNSICKDYEKILEKLGKEYIQTLSCYFSSNLSIKDTSKRLYIHRNTLQYRLRKIKDKMGIDPRSFKGAWILNVVLHYYFCSYERK